jgi:hypothetical protein
VHPAGRELPVCLQSDIVRRIGTRWVKTGSALVEQKISASSPKPDICALMSTRPSHADLL